MEISEAFEMIRDADIDPSRPSAWADLGCGSGIFTHALARVRPEESLIYAVDKSNRFVPVNGLHGRTILFIKSDFENDDLSFPGLDGILMGNSLHYVRDKDAFIKKLIRIQPGLTTFIIIEYDITVSNPWVPYPVDFPGLKKLFSQNGFSGVVKLAERRSLFRRGNLYACSLKKTG